MALRRNCVDGSSPLRSRDLRQSTSLSWFFHTHSDFEAHTVVDIPAGLHSIRPAAESDVEAITDLFNALIATTTYEWTEIPHRAEERSRWLDERRGAGEPVFVAVSGDAVIGVASYGDFRNSTKWPGYRFTVEHSVHVAEGHWGQGVGRALMAALAARARDQGKRVMVAAIDASNVGSIKFHDRLGFAEVARMPGVGEKWGQRLDLVLMQCELAQVQW
jgi:L-amino acid N-acyltransferase YncA